MMDAIHRGHAVEAMEDSARNGAGGMDSMQSITGAIVDSWVERPKRRHEEPRVVLQVAPRGRPGVLMIIEAWASLVPDHGWLQDLGENMCHGSPVAAVGRLTWNGLLDATEIQLAR